MLQDIQEDTAAEGSESFRGAYARRLETRNFEPADWEQVQNYLIGLGLKHLVGRIDALGVDSLEDFGFLYREDLMEAGATKEEAEAILSCTGSAKEGRPEPPPLARSGYNRPSRPAAPLRLAEAAHVRVPDRADRIRQLPNPAQGAQGVQGAIAGPQGCRGDAQGARGVQGAIAGSQGCRGDAQGSRGVQGAIAGSQGCRGDAQGARGVRGAIAGSQGCRGDAQGARGVRGAIAGSQGCQGDAQGARGVQGAIAGSQGCQGDAQGARDAQSTIAGSQGGRGDARGAQGSQGAMAGSRGTKGAVSGAKAFQGAAQSVCVDPAGAQGEAHVEEVLVDPWGRTLLQGEAEAPSALGMPLGQGLPGPHTARRGVQANDAGKTVSGKAKLPGSLIERGTPSREGDGAERQAPGPEPVRFRPYPVEHLTGIPEPVRFRPDPAEPLTRIPGPVRFRPDPAEPLDKFPEPVRFRPCHTEHLAGIPEPVGFRHEGCPGAWSSEASICSLPLAAFVCKSVRELGDEDPLQEVDLVVEDLALCAEPGGARSVEEHLDRIVVELRRLCEQQQQIVLEEAARGIDCVLETLELNRLVELEEELVRELADTRVEISTPTCSQGERISALRLSSLQGDVGGGCEAAFEGQKETDPPLQTKIVSVEEVLKDIEGWWNPMLAEYQALVHEKQVVNPVTAKQLADREAAGEVFQVIPAKLIFTLKAFTARRKVRCVGCGNYLGTGEYTHNQLYAGGLDVVSLRCCLVMMVDREWSAGVVDIKTAFLNAELQPEDFGTRRVIIRTPGLWRRLGICTETFWDVHRALYGLQISPAAWSRCRDRTLPKLRLATSSGVVRLLQFESDGNIWAIVPAEDEEPVDSSRRLGLLLVYVDDMMVLSTPPLIADVIAELAKQWELSTPEFLDQGNIHYRGVEVQRCEGGILVHQGSYTQELLSRYPDKGGAEVPALRLPEVVPAQAQDPQAVRRAQQIAGELLWLSGLTRPEIQFSVGAISRMISVNAEEALTMRDQVIKYLRRYPTRGLWYGPATMTWGEEGDLSVPMGRASLVGFCDASFAPTANRSLQSTMSFYNGALIAWSSTRQTHTTLSTAEAELVGITTLFGELQALEPLVREIQGSKLSMQMHSDSQAAIAICKTASSNWRTRHLRLRASYIK